MGRIPQFDASRRVQVPVYARESASTPPATVRYWSRRWCERAVATHMATWVHVTRDGRVSDLRGRPRPVRPRPVRPRDGVMLTQTVRRVHDVAPDLLLAADDGPLREALAWERCGGGRGDAGGPGLPPRPVSRPDGSSEARRVRDAVLLVPGHRRGEPAVRGPRRVRGDRHAGRHPLGVVDCAAEDGATIGVGIRGDLRRG